MSDDGEHPSVPSTRRAVLASLATTTTLAGCLAGPRALRARDVPTESRQVDRTVPLPVGIDDEPGPQAAGFAVGDGGADPPRVILVWNRADRARTVDWSLTWERFDAPILARETTFPPNGTVGFECRTAATHELTVSFAGRTHAFTVHGSDFDCNDATYYVLLRPDGSAAMPWVTTDVGCGGGPF